MSFRPHDPPTPLLFGYDPVRDLPPDHLARLVEAVVEEALPPSVRSYQPGQPAFDPRLCAKVLIYGYSTGVRSSRQLARLCSESLPYLFLTRGDTPSYRTLCSFRVEHSALLETVWVSLFAVAADYGMRRLGRIVVDSSKFRADASPEAVVKQSEYSAVRAELARILLEAEAADTRDEEEPPGTTQTGQTVEREQMRDILRRVRKQLNARQRTEPSAPAPVAAEPSAVPPSRVLGPRMVPRVRQALKTLEEAEQEGLKQACLTDPDARMMGEGREKRIRECHSFEAVVDKEAGLLVVGQSSQEGNDNARLEPLVEAAEQHAPGGVVAVDADSGYYGGDAMGRLLLRGLDLCVPDSNTACDLKRGHPPGTNREQGRGSVPLTYASEADHYTCPQGNTLAPCGRRSFKGQVVAVYRAQASCVGCPLASACLMQAKAKHRTLKVGAYQAVLEASLQRFADPVHQERYHHRGEVVESVFGFLRSVLGFGRWLLRGRERVGCEAVLWKLAYQLRKVQAARQGQAKALRAA